MNHRVLFVGLGNLGSLMLDLFLRIPGKHQFLVGGRNPDSLQPRVNLSMLSAIQLGHMPKVRCTFLDLNDVDRTAETMAYFQPTIVVCAATRQRLGGVQHLRPPLATRLAHAPLGPRLPLHLSLVYKLMQAVRRSETKPVVLNAIYPDVIHPVLQRVDLAPTAGLGDLANNVPAVRMALASHIEQPLELVDVRLTMARAVSYRISRTGIEGLPFHAAFLVNGEDVTTHIDAHSMFDSLPTTLQRTGGNIGLLMTATSAMSIFEGLVLERECLAHAPGPCGLPGGYPVRLSAQGIEVDLPPSLSLKEALRINESGLYLDGIENIDPNGTVTFTDEAIAPFQEVLGYTCKQMPLAETDEWASELEARYRSLANL